MKKIFVAVAAGATALALAGALSVVGPATFTGKWLNSNYNAATIRALGDSITAGSASSTAANAYVSLISSAIGRPIISLAIGGTQMVDIARYEAYTLTIGTDDQSILLAGYNDMRAYGSSAAGQATYQDALRAALTFLALPDSLKIYAQNASISYTGTWTNNTPYGVVAGKYTTTSGAAASVTVMGSTIYIGYVSAPSLPGGKFTVTIDGVSYGIVDESVGTPPSSIQAITAWPSVFRVSGLSNRPHALVLTTQNANATYLDYVAGNTDVSPNAPRVYLGDTLQMTSTGYVSYSPTWSNGSDAVVAQFNAINRKVARELASDGLGIVYVNASKSYNPNVGHISGDNIHPNDAGHAAIANAFLSHMKSQGSVALQCFGAIARLLAR